jgi:hypothetical protein
MNNLTEREVNRLNVVTRYMGKLGLGDKLDAIIDALNSSGYQEGTPVNAVKANETLTLTDQPTSGDTMTIGDKAYTFVDAETADADGEISVGADLATAQTAIVAAVNGTDGVNTAHPDVTISTFAANIATITALVGGVLGNSISLAETFTANGNVFGGTELSGGVNGTVCLKGEQYIDTDYIYIALDANTIVDANWRRISLGDAY